jgi:hypothetical protein
LFGLEQPDKNVTSKTKETNPTALSLFVAFLLHHLATNSEQDCPSVLMPKKGLSPPPHVFSICTTSYHHEYLNAKSKIHNTNTLRLF